MVSLHGVTAWYGRKRLLYTNCEGVDAGTGRIICYILLDTPQSFETRQSKQLLIRST